MKKILVADDDSGILDAISMMLEFAGYDVTTTMDGASLLTLEALPDLVLLDIWMSGVDGRDICRQLKQQPHTQQTPVVLLSASRHIERSALEAGADDFLAKPFEMDDLLEKVHRFTFHGG
jgi:CheY-like chemotaxis protein